MQQRSGPKGHHHGPEPDIQSDTSEATRLYQRGVAAARGGQKRLAAGFLTRSVQLNPRNEGAWLWLSGVLDDPNQVAFCLNSVLKLNPANERAQRGLRWLNERHEIREKAPAAHLPSIETSAPASTPRDTSRQRATTSQPNDSWWVAWRQWRRDAWRVNLMWWSLPIVVLVLALAIRQSFVLAVEESNRMPAIPTQAPFPAVAPLPQDNEQLASAPIEPIFDAEPSSIRESQTIAYLEELNPLRQQLRDAVDRFRESAGNPGDSMNNIAAAQAWQATVEQVYAEMQTMSPPNDLQAAHETYMAGLQEELTGINHLMEFYGSYRVEEANRAAIRLQIADDHFSRARTLFDARLQQMGAESDISVYTIR
jgi:hypothetical protein